MKRLLAIPLILTLLMPNLMAFAAPSAESEVMACCRRDGKHKCDMAKERREALDPDRERIGAVQEECPMQQSTAAAQAAKFVPQVALALIIQTKAGAALSLITISFARNGLSSHTDRGPPTLTSALA